MGGIGESRSRTIRVRRPAAARQERPARRDSGGRVHACGQEPALWIARTGVAISDAAIVHAGMSETEHRFSRDFQCENVTSRPLDVGPSLRTNSGSRAWGSGEMRVVLNSISDRTIVQYRVCPGSPALRYRYAGRPLLGVGRVKAVWFGRLWGRLRGRACVDACALVGLDG